MPVVVVDQPQFFIVVFAAPLDGLGDVPFGGDFSVRRVGVDRPQVTGFPEDFRDVPGQIPPVGVPGAVFADVPLAHVVVGAFLHGFGAFIDEAHRAVFRVVGDLPDAGGCPDQCLIAVRVVNRLKGGFFSAFDGGVLVERAGCVGGRF